MRKYRNIIFIFLMIMFIPFMVNAKEYCKVVSGNGKDIGSEIACGSEHFYLFSNEDNELRLLSKYNLYMGYVTFSEYVEQDNELTDREKTQVCANISSSNNGIEQLPGYNVPVHYGYRFENISGSNDFYCIYTKLIDVDTLKQNELAVGAHGGKQGGPEYPQYGDVVITPPYGNSNSSDNNRKDLLYATDTGSDTIFKELVVNPSAGLGFTLDSYKSFLESSEYEINNINILSLNEVVEFVRKTDNIDISISSHNGNNNEYGHLAIFPMRELISKNNSWIYSTTYWLRTAYVTATGGELLFVDTLGDICSGSYGQCSQATYPLAGLRPVITISNKLQYLVKTETNDGGTIEVIENSLGGEEIQFKVSINKGYKLGSIVIKTDSGETVEFSEGELKKNSDGTYTIDKNKFTMPFENVIIEGKFVSESNNNITNPKTGSIFLMMLLFLVLFLGLGVKFYFRRKEDL